MQALSTVFIAPSWCTDRFAVYIDNQEPGTSTLNPSSGWVDPSFTHCVPTQYTTKCPTFSPGVCPRHMTIATSTSNVHGTKTIWTGGCCQSGFSTVDFEPRFICTSIISSPMAFLLDPNISTTDIYTTLSTSSLMIEHDQMTVQWENSDLLKLPSEIAKSYASMMEIEFISTVQTSNPTIPLRLAIPQATQALMRELPVAIEPLTTSFQASTRRPASSPAISPMITGYSSSHDVSNSASFLSPPRQLVPVGWLGLIWMLYKQEARANFR